MLATDRDVARLLSLRADSLRIVCEMGQLWIVFFNESNQIFIRFILKRISHVHITEKNPSHSIGVKFVNNVVDNCCLKFRSFHEKEKRKSLEGGLS